MIGSTFSGPAGPILWRDGQLYDISQYLLPRSGYAIDSLGRIKDL